MQRNWANVDTECEIKGTMCVVLENTDYKEIANNLYYISSRLNMV